MNFTKDDFEFKDIGGSDAALSDEELKKRILEDLRALDKHVNASYVQRRFGIGYARAVRLLEVLAEEDALRRITYYMLTPETVTCDDERDGRHPAFPG